MLVKDLSYNDLCKTLIGRKVNFKSDCQFFPNFDVTGKVLSITIAPNNEYLIQIKVASGKIYDIGSNMRNLTFSLLDKASSIPNRN